MTCLRTLLLFALTSLLLSCAPPRKVAVEERKTITQAQETERLGGAHIRIIQPGDTLYGIAFANGLDAKKLAAWNGIEDRAKLRVGQRLRLTRPPGFVARVTTPVKQKPPVKVEKTPTNQRRSNTKPPSSPSSVGALSKTWRWPIQGSVLASYNPGKGQQGIDIAGKKGQPVIAVQPGEVVYVGNGLKGYGNLVIVKHAGEFLSAYAHNLETFVREGQQLKAGERLASVGEFKGRSALHFQVRLNGEPQNPLKYLPKK